MSSLDLQGIDTPNITLSYEPGIKDPIFARHIYLERRSGEGTQTYSKLSLYTTLPNKFHAKSKTRSLPIHVLSLPKENVQIFLANPAKELLEKYVHDQVVLFCIHPATLMRPDDTYVSDILKMKFEVPLKGVPTSSSQTLFILDPKNPSHAIKCHSPFQVSRFNRNLSPLMIQHSIAVSDLLDQLNIPHLPESIGISLPNREGKDGFGFIIREMTPRPFHPEKRLLIPCFALYGRDINHLNEPPLLVKLINNSHENPKDFVLNYVMFPIIEAFVLAFKSQGILLEAHGQNTLLEVDEHLRPTRIIHRDFDNLADGDRRRALGLSCEGFKITPNDPPGGFHSLFYDSLIGHHHFDYLAKVLKEYFQVPEKLLQEACRAKFQELFPDYAQYFPPKVYYYADLPSGETPREAIKYPLVNTGQTPTWRPA